MSLLAISVAYRFTPEFIQVPGVSRVTFAKIWMKTFPVLTIITRRLANVVVNRVSFIKWEAIANTGRATLAIHTGRVTNRFAITVLRHLVLQTTVLFRAISGIILEEL